MPLTRTPVTSLNLTREIRRSMILRHAPLTTRQGSSRHGRPARGGRALRWRPSAPRSAAQDRRGSEGNGCTGGLRASRVPPGPSRGEHQKPGGTTGEPAQSSSTTAGRQSTLSPSAEIPRLSRSSSSTFVPRMTFGTFATVRQCVNRRRCCRV